MIKKNILGLLFLLSALCLFNSCEDDPYYDDYGWATDALCNNTWVDFYFNSNGDKCEQRLDFYNDHTGEARLPESISLLNWKEPVCSLC